LAERHLPPVEAAQGAKAQTLPSSSQAKGALEARGGIEAVTDAEGVERREQRHTAIAGTHNTRQSVNGGRRRHGMGGRKRRSSAGNAAIQPECDTR
jgi:hypothetical protein